MTDSLFDSGYGAATVDPRCAALLERRKEALRMMWKSPIGSAKRRNFEKLANQYGKAYRLCKQGKLPRKPGSSKLAAKVSADVSRALGKQKAEASFEPSAPALPEAVAAPAPSGPPVAALVIGGVAVLALLGVALARGGKAAPATFTAKRSTVRRRRVL